MVDRQKKAGKLKSAAQNPDILQIDLIKVN